MLFILFAWYGMPLLFLSILLAGWSLLYPLRPGSGELADLARFPLWWLQLQLLGFGFALGTHFAVAGELPFAVRALGWVGYATMPVLSAVWLIARIRARHRPVARPVVSRARGPARAEAA